jgi:arsenate reductase
VKTVIFACVHNAGRSQMAAAYFNTLVDPAKARAVSAGTRPGDRVHPEVVQVMAEEGIDLRDVRPQKLTSELAAGAQLLITMGCGDECPYVPGLRRDDWPLDDPKGQPIERVRAIRNDIRARVQALIAQEVAAPVCGNSPTRTDDTHHDGEEQKAQSAKPLAVQRVTRQT